MDPKSFPQKPFSLLLIGALLCAVLGPYSLQAQKKKDDFMFDLPGENAKKPKKRKPKPKFYTGPKLPPIYGPRKEWQSFRSTAQITCAARTGNTLWAGTEGGGIIRWNIKTRGYRFYLPVTEKSPKARDILALATTPKGDLWIGTKGYGVALLKRGRSKWKFYQYKDGLPDNTVQAIAVTPSGTVWVGTQRGAARFSRGKWKRYRPGKGRGGLPAGDIRAIAVDVSGTVWFSPNITTPFVYKNKRFKSIKPFPVVGASCIVPSPKGGLWFCSDQGAAHYNNGRGKLYTTEHGLTGNLVQSIYVDVSGGVWLGTKNRGASFYRDGRWVTMRLAHGLPGNNIRAITGAPGGKLIAATYLNGAAIYSRGRWHRFPVGIVGNKIRAIEYAPDGSVWVGTASGASRYYKGYWYNYTNVLPNPDVRAFTFDPAGNVWIATYGGGVVRYNGRQWKVFEMLDGLGSNRVVGAAISPDGLWFAHEQKGISLYNAGKWKLYNAKNTRHTLNPAYLTQRVVMDPTYTLWIGTKGGGVVRHPIGGGWRKVRRIRGAATKGVVHGIARDAKGRMWFGTKAGLFVKQGKKLTRYSTRQGLPDNHVLDVALEGNKVWVATAKGVGVYDGNSWRAFTQDAGLAANHVVTIAVTPWGEKWFGTARDGLTIYRGE